LQRDASFAAPCEPRELRRRPQPCDGIAHAVPEHARRAAAARRATDTITRRARAARVAAAARLYSTTRALPALQARRRPLPIFVTRAKVKQRHRFLGDLGHAFPAGTMAVGRLDRATEGLLLLTTDGRLSYHVTTAGRVEKEYWAELDGVISDGALAALERGVDVGVRGDGGRARSAPYAARAVAATRLAAPPPLPPRRRRVPAHRPHSWVALTVLDGKYHQVRKMTAAVGFPTLRLVRARIGHLRVGAMRPGDVAPLDAAALGALAPPPGPDGRR